MITLLLFKESNIGLFCECMSVGVYIGCPKRQEPMEMLLSVLLVSHISRLPGSTWLGLLPRWSLDYMGLPMGIPWVLRFPVTSQNMSVVRLSGNEMDEVAVSVVAPSRVYFCSYARHHQFWIHLKTHLENRITRQIISGRVRWCK